MAGQQAASLYASCQDFEFLKATPEWEPPSSILPVDELKERLELVASMEIWKAYYYEAWTEKDAAEWKPFSNHQIAALMVMSLELLRICAGSVGITQVLADGLCQIPSLAKLFLTKPQARDDVGAAYLDPPPESPAKTRKSRRSSDNSTETKCNKLQSSTENHTVGDTSTESDETQLDQEGNAERALDHDSCTIHQTAQPDICHILAVDANATERDSSFIYLRGGTAMSILFPDSPDVFKGYEMANKLFTSGDKEWDMMSLLAAWNMIPLSPQLHKMWSDLYFGFKCLGTVPTHGDNELDGGMTTIKLQFHWMPRKLHATAPLGRTKEGFLGAFDGSYGDENTICTGDIFHLDVPTAHAEDTMLALELRWSLVRIVALAGGIEALEMVDDTSDLLEDGEFPDIVAMLDLDFEEMIRDSEEEEGDAILSPLSLDWGGNGSG